MGMGIYYIYIYIYDDVDDDVAGRLAGQASTTTSSSTTSSGGRYPHYRNNCYVTILIRDKERSSTFPSLHP